MQTTLWPESAGVPNYETIRQELSEQSLTRVPYAIGQAATAEFFRHYRDFTEFCFAEVDSRGKSPLAEALRYTVGTNGAGGYYFEQRIPGTVNPSEPDKPPGTDHKVTLQFGPQTIPRAKAILGGVLPAEMEPFLEECDEYWEEGATAVRPVARALGIERILFTENREDHVFLLRPLDYIAMLGETQMAETHIDRSVLTASLGVSGPGALGTGDTNGVRYPIEDIDNPVFDRDIEDILAIVSRLEPVDQIEYLANVFLGGGLNHLSEPYHTHLAGFNVLFHAVENLSPGESRQALVMFFNTHLKFAGQKTSPGPHETGLGKILEKIRTQKAA